MNREPVKSTMLLSVGYDQASLTLEVEFTDGDIYQYFDVPAAEHAELLRSGSIGSYFSKSIRSSYRYARL